MAYQGGNALNQGDAGDRQEGYGNNIEGIPLDGELPQTESSADPDRAELDFTEKGDLESDYARDYFDAEEERLGDPIAESSGKKTDESWSPGIEDEENMEFAEQTGDIDDDAEGLPEMGPIDVVEKPTPEQLDPASSDRYLTE